MEVIVLVNYEVIIKERVVFRMEIEVLKRSFVNIIIVRDIYMSNVLKG